MCKTVKDVKHINGYDDYGFRYNIYLMETNDGDLYYILHGVSPSIDNTLENLKVFKYSEHITLSLLKRSLELYINSETFNGRSMRGIIDDFIEVLNNYKDEILLENYYTNIKKYWGETFSPYTLRHVLYDSKKYQQIVDSDPGFTRVDDLIDLEEFKTLIKGK